MKARGLLTILLTGSILWGAAGCSSPMIESPVIPEETAEDTIPEVSEETDDTSQDIQDDQPTDAESETESAGILSGIRIGLDPGHQRYANTDMEAVAPNSTETKYKVAGGATGVYTDIPEYVTVLEISQMLRDKLEAEGAEVYMTREDHDVDLSNQERTEMMNQYGVDLMLRIHCDSDENSASSGTTLFVSKSNAVAEQSRLYAETILPQIVNATGGKNRGIIQNDNYTGQNWAEVPCIMIECGFMSNPDEDRLLNTPEYQDILTDGILNGIIQCFG